MSVRAGFGADDCFNPNGIASPNSNGPGTSEHPAQEIGKLEFSWWTEGERFSADAASRLGAQMYESILSGELAGSLFIHIDPDVEPVAESARMTLLFRELADFVLHSGGFEVQGEQPPHVIGQDS